MFPRKPPLSVSVSFVILILLCLYALAGYYTLWFLSLRSSLFLVGGVKNGSVERGKDIPWHPGVCIKSGYKANVRSRVSSPLFLETKVTW
jgi:hypothetical protein